MKVCIAQLQNLSSCVKNKQNLKLKKEFKTKIL